MVGLFHRFLRPADAELVSGGRGRSERSERSPSRSKLLPRGGGEAEGVGRVIL